MTAGIDRTHIKNQIAININHCLFVGWIGLNSCPLLINIPLAIKPTERLKPMMTALIISVVPMFPQLVPDTKNKKRRPLPRRRKYATIARQTGLVVAHLIRAKPRRERGFFDGLSIT